jgi:hypothetical protein
VDTTEETISVGAAVDRLHAAVAGLVDPVKRSFDGVVRVAPSLYHQLRAEIPASAGREKVRLHVASRSPAWLDAVDLLDEIDTAVEAWQAAGVDTADRLRVLAARRWRPQDVRGIGQIVEAVNGWVVAVAGLLEPQRVKTISAACPACDTRYVYRQRDGERVRQPALQVVAEKGCTCLSCGAAWAPELYLHLVRLLGFELPPGVLE